VNDGAAYKVHGVAYVVCCRGKPLSNLADKLFQYLFAPLTRKHPVLMLPTGEHGQQPKMVVSMRRTTVLALCTAWCFEVFNNSASTHRVGVTPATLFTVDIVRIQNGFFISSCTHSSTL
jgi:hypothetical protein